MMADEEFSLRPPNREGACCLLLQNGWHGSGLRCQSQEMKSQEMKSQENARCQMDPSCQPTAGAALRVVSVRSAPD